MNPWKSVSSVVQSFSGALAACDLLSARRHALCVCSRSTQERRGHRAGGFLRRGTGTAEDGRQPYRRRRVLHQSSHLGDEFLLRNRTTRINLSYEALDLLLSYETEFGLRL
jgi:hypothetical protein